MQKQDKNVIFTLFNIQSCRFLLTLRPCNERMTNNLRFIHRQKTLTANRQTNIQNSLAVLHRGLVACRDTAWGLFL